MYEWFKKAEEGDLDYITQLIQKNKHVIDQTWDGQGYDRYETMNEFSQLVMFTSLVMTLPFCSLFGALSPIAVTLGEGLLELFVDMMTNTGLVFEVAAAGAIDFAFSAQLAQVLLFFEKCYIEKNKEKSLLEFAANTGKTNIAIYLIRQGANTKNRFLTIAAKNGHVRFVEECVAFLLEIETINHGIEATKQAEQKTKTDTIEGILKNYQQSYDAQYKSLLIKNKQVIDKLTDLTETVELASIMAATSELRELDNIRDQLSTHHQALINTLDKLVDFLVDKDRKLIQSLFQQFKPRIRELQSRKKELIHVMNEFKAKDFESRTRIVENGFSYSLNGCNKLTDENRELLNKLDLSEQRIEITIELKKKIRSNCEIIKREFERNAASFKEFEPDPLFKDANRHLLPASIQRSVQTIKDTINKLTQTNNEVEIQYQEAFGDINEQYYQFQQVVDSHIREDWTTLYADFGKLHDQFKDYEMFKSTRNWVPGDLKTVRDFRDGFEGFTKVARLSSLKAESIVQKYLPGGTQKQIEALIPDESTPFDELFSRYNLKNDSTPILILNTYEKLNVKYIKESVDHLLDTIFRQYSRHRYSIEYNQLLSESRLILEKPAKATDIQQLSAIRNGIKHHLDLINAVLDDAYIFCINADNKIFTRINHKLEELYNERDKLKNAYDDLQLGISPSQPLTTASALLISSIIEYAGLLKDNFKLETDGSTTDKYNRHASVSAKVITQLIDACSSIPDDGEASFTKLYFNKVRIKRITQGIKSNYYLGQCDQCLSELSAILSPPQWSQQTGDIENSNDNDRLNQLRIFRRKIRELFYILESEVNHINKFINDKSKHLYHLELKYSNDKLDILLELMNYKKRLNDAYNRVNRAIAVNSMQANLKDTNTDAPVIKTLPITVSATNAKETSPIANTKTPPTTAPTTANKAADKVVDKRNQDPHPTNPGSNSAGLFHQAVIPGLCFDRAVNLGPRAVFVRFALDHAAEESFRNLLAPEIKLAALLVSDSEGALPAIMRNPERQQIIDNYDLAHRNMQPAINLCCDALGYPEGRRLNLDELKTFFNQANHQSRFQAAYQQLLQAESTILAPAEAQLNDYTRRIDIYRDYITHYYGMEGWFVFNNTFTGESKTSSMIDISAKFLNKKIEIYTNNIKVYETAVYGSEVVTVDYNGQNHFTPRVRQSNANQPGMTLK